MEPNTSCPSATRTSSAIVEQALSSGHAESLHSPPSQCLVFASGSRFRSPAVGDGSLYVHPRATSRSLPSSFFPTLQAPAASPFPTPLGSQPWQWLGLPSCPLAALEQIAARPLSLMSFLLPMAGSGRLFRSSGDHCIGVAQAGLSSHSELPPLPASLRIPSLEEASTYSITGGTIGRSMLWHHGDSSLDIGRSISLAPMLAPIPPSSHGTSARSNFIGLAQPSSHTELAPLPAFLQTPLLPVNQDELDQEALRLSMPENSSASFLSWKTTMKPPVESRSYNVSSTIVAGSTPCQDGSSSMDISNSSSAQKLSQPLPPSPLRAGANTSSINVPAGVIFTDAEKEIIRKDRSLQELVNTDPKRVKRNLSNRISAAKRKAIKDTHTLELRCKVEALHREYNALSAEVKSRQERCDELETGNKELRMKIKDLEQQALLKDAESERLKARLKALIRMKLKQRK